MEKVLIIDNDEKVCDLIRRELEGEGYSTIISTDGNEAMVKFYALRPDLVIIDVMLPGVDGWNLCRDIRKEFMTPIIIVTSRVSVADKVLGFELGADDYIGKPFEVKELIARVKSVMRRTDMVVPQKECNEIFYDKLHVNLSKYSMKVNGEIVDTPPKELELLFFLASNPNRVYTRDQLLDEVWGFEYYGDSRTVDVHIKRLRKKLEGVSDKWALKTVWGRGYKFETIDSKKI